MSWYSKVAWTEGLFLRPHHFQQNDRYHEHLLESTCTIRHALSMGIYGARDRPRSCPAEQVCPAAGLRRDARRDAVRYSRRQPSACGHCRAGHGLAADRLADDADGIAQHTQGRRPRRRQRRALHDPFQESFIGSTSSLRIEEDVDIAFPRLTLELRKTAKPGFTSLGIARVLSGPRPANRVR